MAHLVGSGQTSRGGSAEQPNDPLWRVTAYRLAIEITDQAWRDSELLATRHNTRSLADQLYRATGSISANLAEGYSRSSGKDRVRFFEYALGSARECKAWYHLGRHALDPKASAHQQDQLDRICQLLIATIPRERIAPDPKGREQRLKAGLTDPSRIGAGRRTLRGILR